MKGEPSREGALTREEFFVVEQLILLSLASGKELITSPLLTHYNLVQSISCTLEPKPLLLRKKITWTNQASHCSSRSRRSHYGGVIQKTNWTMFLKEVNTIKRAEECHKFFNPLLNFCYCCAYDKQSFRKWIDLVAILSCNILQVLDNFFMKLEKRFLK